MTKKAVVFAGTLLAMAYNTNAQGLFYRFGLGYAIPQAGQTMDGTATPLNGSMTNTTSGTTNYTAYDIKKASFSSGLHGTVAVGYLFNEHVGIDVSLSGLFGAQKYSFFDYNVAINGVASNVEITQSASCILATPSLYMQTNGKINLYSRVGIALPLKTRVYQDQIFTNLPGTGAIQAEDYYWEIKNKFGLGFNAAAGITFRVNRRLSLWTEASFLSLAVFTKEAELKEVYVNGQGGYLQYVSQDQRKVTYGTNFTATTNDYFHQPTYSQPFGNMTFSVGVYYGLNNSGKSRAKGKNDVRSRRK